MGFKQVFAIFATLLITSCAAVSSTPYDIRAGNPHGGLSYAMPKGLLRVQLIQARDDMYLAVSEPFFVGDASAAYLLESSSGIFANQEYLFVVHPQTRLLSYVNSASEGQAREILQNLVSSISGVGAAGPLRERGEQEFVVYSRVVDPMAFPGCGFAQACDMTPLSAELRTAALGSLRCGEASGASELCPSIEANPNFFRLRLDPLFSIEQGPPARGRSDSDCRHAICYRIPVPYSMTVAVGARTSISEIVSLPNGAPVMALRVPAGVFADARAKVQLYQGMPARYVVDRDSEAVSVALLPLDLVRSAFTAVGEVMQLRINYNNVRAQEIESQRRVVEARPQAPGAPAQDEGERTRDALAPYADTSNGELFGQPTGTTALAGSALAANRLFTIPLSGSGVAQAQPQ